jgi:uncharacterized protein YlxW (UPF0749 family)
MPEPRTDNDRKALLSQLAYQPSRPHLMIGLLFLVLGLLVTVAIVRPGQETDEWRTARTEDLVQILDDLGARKDRLQAESARLTALQRDLESGSTAQAIQEARRRLEALRVLAGTTPVVGPGLEVVITDPGGSIDAPVLVDAIQELRDAGAEALQVGSTRVVVDTWFADSPTGLVVNGEPLSSPITILAIGDPDTMSAALSIPGGLAESVRTRGADFAASTVTDMSISVTVPETSN